MAAEEQHKLIRPMDAIFFNSPAELRAWLAENHDKASELWVGFYKKDSGRLNYTYNQALDEALCFGWIDGVRKSVDGDSYVMRFTPRKRGSYWSAVNTKRANELIELGLMQPPGLKAFEARDPAKTQRYSFERETADFDADDERKFKTNAEAWDRFQQMPPSYRKAAIWWVVSAKRPKTRAKRLDTLIEDSANGRKVAPLRRPGET